MFGLGLRAIREAKLTLQIPFLWTRNEQRCVVFECSVLKLTQAEG